jgi:hypothetical protein
MCISDLHPGHCCGIIFFLLTNQFRVGPLSPRHGASSRCGWREVLRLRRVAANILNKKSRTAEGVVLQLGRFGVGLTAPHCKIFLLLRNVSKLLGPGLILCFGWKARR